MAISKKAKKLIEDQMPGMRIVEPSRTAQDDSQTIAPQAGGSLEQLRRKFLGGPAQPASAGMTADEEADDVEVVHVVPKDTSADPADQLGPRAVIVSASKGILGVQG
jgi:hypothetical protein